MVKVNRNRNHSAFDRHNTDGDKDNNTEKSNHFYAKNFATNFMTDYRETVDSKVNTLIPLIKHKRKFENIQMRTGIKGDSFNLNKFYDKSVSNINVSNNSNANSNGSNGNDNNKMSYSRNNNTTVSWSIKEKDKNNNNNNKISKVNYSISKSKFINDMLLHNPIKSFTIQEKMIDDKLNRMKRSRQVSSVTNYLSSNGVKSNMHLTNPPKFNELQAYKITNSNYDSEAAKKMNGTQTKEKMKFQHLYDSNNRAYYS